MNLLPLRKLNNAPRILMMRMHASSQQNDFFRVELILSNAHILAHVALTFISCSRVANFSLFDSDTQQLISNDRRLPARLRVGMLRNAACAAVGAHIGGGVAGYDRASLLEARALSLQSFIAATAGVAPDLESPRLFSLRPAQYAAFRRRLSGRVSYSNRLVGHPRIIVTTA